MINLIEEADVSAVNLSMELEKAVIQHELREDGSLYVFESGFPFWTRVLKKSGFVGLFTFIRFRDTSTQLERLQLANSFNKNSFMLTAYLSGEEMRIDHVLSYRDGMLKETFIRGCHNFPQIVERAILDFDPDYKLLMRLSEMSSEDQDQHRDA